MYNYINLKNIPTTAKNNQQLDILNCLVVIVYIDQGTHQQEYIYLQYHPVIKIWKWLVFEQILNRRNYRLVIPYVIQVGSKYFNFATLMFYQKACISRKSSHIGTPQNAHLGQLFSFLGQFLVDCKKRNEISMNFTTCGFKYPLLSSKQ